MIHCPVAEGEIPPSGTFWDLGMPETAADGATRERIAHARERHRAAGQRPFV